MFMIQLDELFIPCSKQLVGWRSFRRVAPMLTFARRDRLPDRFGS